MSMASRAILSNFFEKQWIQNHPQYLSGLSRAVHPTTFLKIAAYLQGQYFQHFFPFVCNIFLVYSLLWLYLLSMLSLLLFLQSLPGFQSYKPGSLIPCRMTGASRVFSYIVLTVPLYLSGCNSLVSVFPSDGSREWYIRWLRFFSNLIGRSSRTAVSCCSVLAVCPTLSCLVFVPPSFIHAESVHEFALLACCYFRWVNFLRYALL